MKFVLAILISLIATVTYGQIGVSDIEYADLLVDDFQSYTDSIKQLTNGATVYYFSDTMFKGITLTVQNGAEIELDFRYKDNFRGYTKIGADFENFVLVKVRGDGSGNPALLRVINKKTGEDSWLGDYPFYIDTRNEVVVYKSQNDGSSYIVVHNFQTNRIEKYPTPETNCTCCECFEVIQVDQESFTLKFEDANDKSRKLKILRENE